MFLNLFFLRIFKFFFAFVIHCFLCIFCSYLFLNRSKLDWLFFSSLFLNSIWVVWISECNNRIRKKFILIIYTFFDRLIFLFCSYFVYFILFLFVLIFCYEMFSSRQTCLNFYSFGCFRMINTWGKNIVVPLWMKFCLI